MSRSIVVEDLELTSAEVEAIIADHIRKERMLPEDTEVQTFGILNRVYISITTEEVIPNDARNETGSRETPANANSQVRQPGGIHGGTA